MIRHCDVILGMLVLFWNVLKEETPIYTMVSITCIWGFYFQVHGGGNLPWEDVLPKKKMEKKKQTKQNKIKKTAW